MKTVTYTSLVLFLVSLSVNIFLWWKGAPPTCNSTPGYEPPAEITKDEVRGFSGQFNGTVVTDVKGGILTRSTFDEIMCNNECNAITYTFAVDSLGRTGPPGNNVFLIFSGAKVVFDSQSNRIERVVDLGISYYVPRNWCPPSCLLY